MATKRQELEARITFLKSCKADRIIGGKGWELLRAKIAAAERELAEMDAQCEGCVMRENCAIPANPCPFPEPDKREMLAEVAAAATGKANRIINRRKPEQEAQ